MPHVENLKWLETINNGITIIEGSQTLQSSIFLGQLETTGMHIIFLHKYTLTMKEPRKSNGIN